MRALKTLEKSFSKSPDEVFDALKKIVTDKPYTLNAADGAARTVEFESGGGLTSMGHYMFAAQLAPADEGTHVTLNIHTGENTPQALLDGWKNKKAGEKFLAKLDEAV